MSKTVVPTTDGRRVAISTPVLKSLATTRERAKSAMVGYEVHPIDAPNGWFLCQRPRNAPKTFDSQGQEILGYDVNVVSRTCTCHVWINTKSQLGEGECKHLTFTSKVVEKSLRVLGLWNSPRTLEDCAEQEVRGGSL